MQIVTLGLFHFTALANSYTYHYPCIVLLQGLANLQLVYFSIANFANCINHSWDNGPYGGYRMVGIGLNLTPILVKCLLGLLGGQLVLLGLVTTLNNVLMVVFVTSYPIYPLTVLAIKYC